MHTTYTGPGQGAMIYVETTKTVQLPWPVVNQCSGMNCATFFRCAIAHLEEALSVGLLVGRSVTLELKIAENVRNHD